MYENVTQKSIDVVPHRLRKDTNKPSSKRDSYIHILWVSEQNQKIAGRTVINRIYPVIKVCAITIVPIIIDKPIVIFRPMWYMPFKSVPESKNTPFSNVCRQILIRDSSYMLFKLSFYFFPMCYFIFKHRIQTRAPQLGQYTPV